MEWVSPGTTGIGCNGRSLFHGRMGRTWAIEKNWRFDIYIYLKTSYTTSLKSYSNQLRIQPVVYLHSNKVIDITFSIPTIYDNLQGARYRLQFY